MNSTLHHSTAFVVLKWNCCGYEQPTASFYSFCSFEVKLLWLWSAQCVIVQLLEF